MSNTWSWIHDYNYDQQNNDHSGDCDHPGDNNNGSHDNVHDDFSEHDNDENNKASDEHDSDHNGHDYDDNFKYFAVPWPELNPRPKSKHKRMESLQSTGFHNYSANLTIFSNFLLQKPLSTPTRFSDIFEKTASSRRSFSVAGSALLSVELPTHERSRFCPTDFA